MPDTQRYLDTIKSLDHISIARSTFAELARGYSNAKEMQKAVIDVLWGVDEIPKEHGAGAYNIILQRYVNEKV